MKKEYEDFLKQVQELNVVKKVKAVKKLPKFVPTKKQELLVTGLKGIGNVCGAGKLAVFNLVAILEEWDDQAKEEMKTRVFKDQVSEVGSIPTHLCNNGRFYKVANGNKVVLVYGTGRDKSAINSNLANIETWSKRFVPATQDQIKLWITQAKASIELFNRKVPKTVMARIKDEVDKK